VFSFFKRKSLKPLSSRGLFVAADYAPGREWSNPRDYVGGLPFSLEYIAAYSAAQMAPLLHHCRIGKITLKQNDRPI
jgi:hypothetical protein